MFAVTQPGLENICARDLVELGMENVKPLEGGIEFRGGIRELYLANLRLRSASRVLVRAGTFKCRDFPTLYKKALQIPWGRFIRPATGFRVQASSHGSRLLHSDRISETIEAAISHSLGVSQTTSNGPQQTVLARLDQDHCVLSVDSSGDLLHRRGYRDSAVAAPLRETLAAGILGMLNWHGEMPLLDPMCGSGTFPIEAALLAANRPPGARRDFAFMNWPHYRPGLWTSLVEASNREIRRPASPIFASDRDTQAVEATRRNAGNAQVGGEIDIRQASLSELEVPAETGLILCNPPYGKRIYGDNDPTVFYREMGRIYRRNFRGWILGLVCPPRLAKATGLPLEKIGGFRNGGIKIQLFRVLL